MKVKFARKNIFGTLVLLLAVVFFSCQNNVSGVDSTGTGNTIGIGGYFFPDATTVRQKKESHVYCGGSSLKTIKTVYLEGWEDVPFLDVDDACGLLSLYNDRGSKVTEEDGIWKYNYNKENAEKSTWPEAWDGDTMYFDPKSQTVWSDDFVRMICSADSINNGYGGDSVTAIDDDKALKDFGYGPCPKIQESTDTAPIKAKERTVIHLDDYGLKMFVIDDVLYVPFHVLFSTFNQIGNFVFNGTDYYLYLDVSDDLTTMHKAFESGRHPSSVRSRLMAEYNYRVLCLTFDANYCLKSERAQMGKDNITFFNDSIFAAGLGFDLLSTDTAVYDKALVRFLLGYIDDGHTNWQEPSMYQSMADIQAYRDYRRKNIGPRVMDFINVGTQVKDLRKSAGGKQGVFYVSDGGEDKMAVIAFDGFQWNGVDGITEPDPAASDYPKARAEYLEALANANTYKFFEAAFADIAKPEHSGVNNVVIDLSCNGGGAVNQCFVSLCYLADSANFSFPYKNYLDKSVTKFKYIVNDGVSLKKNYNFYVLTSKNSFSCGNIFPSVCKYQLNIPIVGKRSGGGACIVKFTQTADGAVFQTSASREIRGLNGATDFCVDDGIPVDLDIDYNDFYSDSRGGDKPALYWNLYSRLKAAYSGNF